MIMVMDEPYLTEKEASLRYGYSQRWFIKMRSLGLGPKYIQIRNNGRVLYPLHRTDSWFKERMKEKE